MRWLKGLPATLAVAVMLAGAGSASAQSDPLNPNFPWPSLLPPLEVPNTVQPGPVSYCRSATIGCIDETIRRMRALRARLGCDHRAVFATTYLLLTEEIRSTVVRDPHFYDDNEWLLYLDTLFAKYYFDTNWIHDAGRGVPQAWEIAFNTAAHGDANAGQDLLLGINAHVQRDMAYVMADEGLRMRDGRSRKPDHDRGNEVLQRGYEPIVKTLAEQYDPLIATSNSEATPIDNMAGLEMVKEWREGVWRNAERLLNAKSQEERASIAQRIEDDAAYWARSIAANDEPPGYRAYRDAYCRAHLRLPGQAAPAAGGPRLFLSVRPRRALAGERMRYRFRVTGQRPGGRRRAVRRATVRFAGKRVRTNRRGRAAITMRLRKPRLRPVLARKKGLGRDVKVIRIVARPDRTRVR
jgi:Family of unknown function (DUF5995)